VTVVERQVHGYRQGHRLLAASVQLAKEEQSVVDRLSDVAGPLRPRERFDPYLTAYPLPGGDRFVLARTWQDSSVARAGCVRTLSLIIPASDWAEAAGLSAFFDILDIGGLPDETYATRVVVDAGSADALLPVSGFEGSELLEALFLEDPRPVAVLGAEKPDLIATRLLTALWPSLRRRFAVSTFALSPRKLAGRDFDLLFAPIDARAKFSDWSGRRIDGRAAIAARHRWTGAIVDRVFEQPYPRLLSRAETELVGGGDRDTDTAAALRIALLWDELAGKLETTPTAALGLLDIANSGKVRDRAALKSIEPALAAAALRGSQTLSEQEAWNFLGAIARKLRERQMPLGRIAVAEASEKLAARAPEGAIALLSDEDLHGVVAAMLPRIAAGIADAFTERSEQALLAASPVVLGKLLAGGGPLIERVVQDRPLVEHLAQALPQMSTETLDAVGERMLPLLTEDWQLPAAEPLISHLDAPHAISELRRRGETDGFKALQLSDLIAQRARLVAPRSEVRATLVSLPSSERRNTLIASTLLPEVEDARWLYSDTSLGRATADSMLIQILREADDRQFQTIITDAEVGAPALHAMQGQASDLALRAVAGDALPLETFASLLSDILRHVEGSSRTKLAKHALARLLGNRFGGDETALLVSALNCVGDQLDGAWAARMGLARNIDTGIANRNIVAFRKANQAARLRVVWSIAEVAQVLRDRRSLDLDPASIDAVAAFMSEAEKVTPKAFMAAAGYLLPVLFRSKNRPVSPLIAIAFPPVHREFAQSDDIPEFLKFIPFLDWDRSKGARHELVEAFMSSSWPPRDLALTACRANEVERVLRRVAKQERGSSYLKRLASDARSLPDGCRGKVGKVLSQIRANPAARYDWRD